MSGEVPEEFLELSRMLRRAEEEAERAQSPDAVAARRARRKRGVIVAGAVSLLVAAVIGTYLPLTLFAPLGSVAASTERFGVDVPDAVTIALPPVGATAISVTGAEDRFPGTAGTRGILARSGGDDPRPIASITKVITTLVILDAEPIGPGESGPVITFSAADAKLYDEYYVRQASIWPMKAGSTVTLREALRVMLVVSATNYADAVSTRVFGSAANFRSSARSWLDARGFTGTTIVEPTGLDPRNVSTPTELIAIGKLAMAHPVIAESVRARDLAMPNGRHSSNTNDLLGVDGINGIKTGTLDAAGACLLFSAVLDVGGGLEVTVVGVVLGGDNRYQVNNAVRALLASLRAGFHEVPVIVKGQRLGKYTTEWGEEASIVAADDASIFTWSDMAISRTLVTREISTARSGAVVGNVEFRSGQESVTVPLVLDADIEGPDGWWRLAHPVELLVG